MTDEKFDIISALIEELRIMKEKNDRLSSVLKWYADTVGDCNRSGKDGDTARDRLAKDHGSKAEEALEEGV